LGLLVENGSNFVSLHYYDGNDNGNPKLDIANMGFSGGWPFITRDWIAAGQYRITNKNSGLVWDAWGCTGASGQGIAQGAWNNLTCQKWNFAPVGDGYYRITNSLGGLSADVINCGTAAGTLMQLYAWLNNNCQKYKVERLGDGSHIMTPLSGARIVSVAGSSTTAGTRLSLQDFSDCNCQKWQIAAQTAREDVSQEPLITEERLRIIYPNPVLKGQQLTVVIGSPGKYVSTRIFTSDGRLVYASKRLATNNLQVPAPGKAGVYLIQVESDEGIIRQKLVVE
jgi:arabinan endo-1,5-alpha-L-arabinosidase